MSFFYKKTKFILIANINNKFCKIGYYPIIMERSNNKLSLHILQDLDFSILEDVNFKFEI